MNGGTALLKVPTIEPRDTQKSTVVKSHIIPPKQKPSKPSRANYIRRSRKYEAQLEETGKKVRKVVQDAKQFDNMGVAVSTAEKYGRDKSGFQFNWHQVNSFDRFYDEARDTMYDIILNSHEFEELAFAGQLAVAEGAKAAKVQAGVQHLETVHRSHEQSNNAVLDSLLPIKEHIDKYYYSSR